MSLFRQSYLVYRGHLTNSSDRLYLCHVKKFHRTCGQSSPYEIGIKESSMTLSGVFVKILVWTTPLLIALTSRASEGYCEQCGASGSLSQSQQEQIVQAFKASQLDLSKIAGQDRVVEVRVTVRDRASTERATPAVLLNVGSDSLDLMMTINNQKISDEQKLEKTTNYSRCECFEGCPCSHCSGKSRNCTCQHQN